MANININQKQSLSQLQTQKLSQKQIQALNFLHMSTNDLRDAIYKAVEENPALEIVYDPKTKDSEGKYSKQEGMEASDRFQSAIEQSEDKKGSLQDKLMRELSIYKLDEDEYKLSILLINNLDKYGFYGSSVSPETFLDKARPLQTKKMLERCIERIQTLEPEGCCTKNFEESLYVQAKLKEDVTPLTLFILDGNIDLISPPVSEEVYKKLIELKKDWNKKEFAKDFPLELKDIKEEDIDESISFIKSLNPFPGQGYEMASLADFETPDVVAIVEEEAGPMEDDFTMGVVKGDDKKHFQIKYASGVLPEVSISKTFIEAGDRKNVNDAKNFIDMLLFRQSSLVDQVCAIVSMQRSFFLKGERYLKPMTRKEVASVLGIHESTVSRLSSKKYSKYIQTSSGLYPLSYFFTTGITYKGKSGERKLSSEVIKLKIQSLLEGEGKGMSDNALTKKLNEKGLMIARRTVAKYRKEIGIENSYKRDK